jgi:RNA polymerase sigma-70 factor (ECF subfamily)
MQSRYADKTDAELIAEVRNGRTEAFRGLVERYEGQVAATVIGMLGQGAEVQDVGQEVFVRFYRSLEGFRGEAALGTYLTRIAMNLCYNEIGRRMKQRERAGGGEAALLGLVDVDDRTGSGPERSDIRQAILALDTKFRSVVVLRLVKGHTTEETAHILGVPMGTVLSRLSRAQKMLAERLREYETRQV